MTQYRLEAEIDGAGFNRAQELVLKFTIPQSSRDEAFKVLDAKGYAVMLVVTTKADTRGRFAKGDGAKIVGKVEVAE